MPDINTTEEYHKALTLWAAECAERVLSVFELEHNDNRPRQAIEAARAWVNGDLKMTEARKFAFAAHAAAQEAKSTEASAAARSAGHAAATSHVADHAQYAAQYALKASSYPELEKEWQDRNMPKYLNEISDT